MSKIIEVKVEELNALPATKIVESENVQAKFVQMFKNFSVIILIWQIRQRCLYMAVFLI